MNNDDNNPGSCGLEMNKLSPFIVCELLDIFIRSLRLYFSLVRLSFNFNFTSAVVVEHTSSYTPSCNWLTLVSASCCAVTCSVCQQPTRPEATLSESCWGSDDMTRPTNNNNNNNNIGSIDEIAWLKWILLGLLVFLCLNNSLFIILLTVYWDTASYCLSQLESVQMLKN